MNVQELTEPILSLNTILFRRTVKEANFIFLTVKIAFKSMEKIN